MQGKSLKIFALMRAAEGKLLCEKLRNVEEMNWRGQISPLVVWESRKSMKFSRSLFHRVSTRCLEITRGVHGPPWACIAPSPLYCSWYNHMELGFCDLGSKLASDSSNNIILFFRDVEDLLTSHLCSSMNSHLDVLVASYQNELITCIIFCKITLI